MKQFPYKFALAKTVKSQSIKLARLAARVDRIERSTTKPKRFSRPRKRVRVANGFNVRLPLDIDQRLRRLAAGSDVLPDTLLSEMLKNIVISSDKRSAIEHEKFYRVPSVIRWLALPATEILELRRHARANGLSMRLVVCRLIDQFCGDGDRDA